MSRVDKLTFEEALARLRRYCAYQERSHHDVRTKLLDLKIYGDMLEQIMTSLIEDDFLNELRYANAFTSGKYRINAWGRRKIRYALKGKFVSEYCVRKAIEDIDFDEYSQVLEHVLRKYHSKYNNLSDFELRGRLFKFAYNKGYEKQEINTAISAIMLSKYAN